MSQPTPYLRPSPAVLLWLLSVPVLVFGCTELCVLGGNILYAHGPSSYMLLLAAGWGLIAFIWAVVAVAIWVYKLSGEPALRTRMNVAALSLAVLYAIGFLGVAANL